MCHSGDTPATFNQKLLNERNYSRSDEPLDVGQVVADAVQFLGAPSKGKHSEEPDEQPADRPAIGAYRRKAS